MTASVRPTQAVKTGRPRGWFTPENAGRLGSRGGKSTSTAKRRAARQNGMRRAKGQWPLVKGRQDWATPQVLFAALDREFHFTLDVAASAVNAKCRRYFTEADDGLAQRWAPERCWMNPPYAPGVLPLWVRKAHEEAGRGALVIGLLPARTDTRCWHDFVMGAEVRFLPGRVRFVLADRSSSSPFPSAVVVFRPPSTSRIAEIRAER